MTGSCPSCGLLCTQSMSSPASFDVKWTLLTLRFRVVVGLASVFERPVFVARLGKSPALCEACICLVIFVLLSIFNYSLLLLTFLVRRFGALELSKTARRSGENVNCIQYQFHFINEMKLILVRVRM